MTILRNPPIVDASIMNTPMSMEAWIFFHKKKKKERKKTTVNIKKGQIKFLIEMHYIWLAFQITQLINHLALNLLGFLIVSHIMLGSWM